MRTNEALIEIKKSTELLQADIMNHKEKQKQELTTSKATVTHSLHIPRERPCRVVLFGITEIDRSDLDYLKMMLFNIFASVERFGRRPTDFQGPDSRPIRTTFRDSVSARECLKQAPAQKTKGYEKVYMSRDLSKRDRMKRREIVKELKAKIASQIDRYWVIKDGKVVDGGERRDRTVEASFASPARTRSSSRTQKH